MKSKVFWIARNKYASYGLGNSRMKIDENGLVANHSLLLCAYNFERITGLKFEKESKKKFRLVEVKQP